MSEEKIDPIRPADFGLAAHKYQQHNAFVDGGLKKEDLTNPSLWTNCGVKMRDGDEIRVVANDYSFLAYLFVKFVRGSDVRLELMNYVELDEVAEDETQAEYFIKNRGRARWCVIQRSTSDVIKKDIATQSEAQKELEEYVRALNS